MEAAMQLLASTVSVDKCAICLEDKSSDLARAIPCTHEFHTTCISTVLKSSGLKGRRCPICRTPMLELHYDFLHDGNHRTHPIGPMRPESPLMSGPFIRSDEELRAEMSPAEQSRVLELRRIREGGPYHLIIRVHKIESFGHIGNQAVKMRRLIELDISQDPYEASTTSIITRTTSIKFAPAVLGPVISADTAVDLGEERIVPDDSELIAREEARTRYLLIERCGVHHDEFTELSMTGLEHKLQFDSKGFSATVKKTITAIKNGDMTTEQEFKVSAITELHEVYTVRPRATTADGAEEDGVEKKFCEEVIRLAREEIQGVLEYGFVHWEAFVPMEGASSGVLEVRWKGVCEYCGGGHRNGDCELDLDEIASVHVDDGSG